MFATSFLSCQGEDLIAFQIITFGVGGPEKDQVICLALKRAEVMSTPHECVWPTGCPLA